MLARLVLLALQLAIGWFAGREIVRYIPRFGDLQIFIYALAFAVVVWLLGLILAQVLRDTPTPSSGTLVASIIVALIGAAITWLPVFLPDLGYAISRLDRLAYPLIGAVLGYHLRR
jgi:hypothetical protein